MPVDKNVYISLLNDFYGELLTDKQRQYIDLYYNDNLSYIRRLSAEFAREFPNVAARLDLNAI